VRKETRVQTFDGNSPDSLLFTSIIDVTGAITGLASCTFLIFTALVVEDKAAVAWLDPGSRGSLMVVLHNTFDRFLPGTHLLGVGHLNPFRRAKFFQEAAVLSNQSEIGDTLKKTIKLFWLAARHNVDSVAIIEEEIIQDIKSALQM
jgi:hypothetical protein